MGRQGRRGRGEGGRERNKYTNTEREERVKGVRNGKGVYLERNGATERGLNK